MLCSYKCCFISILQKGFTPLHEAARNGHVRIVEILLKYYDNPDPEGKVSELLCVGIISSKFMAALWRCGGLMVGALVSGSSGLGSSPARDIVLCSWARHFTLTVPLSTQVYKWVLTNLMMGVNLQCTGFPSRGE